jgi:hypothetical protein
MNTRQIQAAKIQNGNEADGGEQNSGKGSSQGPKPTG